MTQEDFGMQKKKAKREPVKRKSTKIRKTYFIEESLVETVRVFAFNKRLSVSRVINDAIKQYIGRIKS